MPLIPYPNVPVADGVPPMSRRQAQIAAQVTAAAAASGIVLDGYSMLSQGQTWQILAPNGGPAVTPDSVLQLEYRGESRVLNSPVENGAFASYNKVASPYDLHLVITCSGSKTMRRDDFLAALGSMADSTDVFTVVTPDQVYPNCNLVSFDYRRQSNNGATMIIAACYFQEIRQTAAASYESTKEADGADPVNNGSTAAQTPTTAEAAQISADEVQ